VLLLLDHKLLARSTIFDSLNKTADCCMAESEAKGLTASGLVEVHVDPFQLQVRVAMVGARGVHAMLVTDHLYMHKCFGDEACPVKANLETCCGARTAQ
jgi:hypothetical protein